MILEKFDPFRKQKEKTQIGSYHNLKVNKCRLSDKNAALRKKSENLINATLLLFDILE